jgi:hypothetical protein
MNLWAKSLGRLTMLAVALFFFSCEDEASILGFKNPNQKFKVNYYEIPLESSVMLIDSLRTSNTYVTGETNRLLVGKYLDDRFGEVSSTAFTQFYPANTSKTLLSETAKLDSVTVTLRFDFYLHGVGGKTSQTISVHEVTKDLIYDSLNYYFNRSNTSYNPTALGSKTFSVNTTEINQYITDRKDTAITVRILLDKTFGDRLFALAVKYRNSTTAADSAFVRYSELVKEFKGLAFVPGVSDKMMGFSPASPSRITLHYKDDTTDSLELNLLFNGTLNYNKIKANAGATELAGLTNYHQDFFPASDLRYVQAGTGIVTKLDFTKLYEFADADSNANTLINSAELFISDSEVNSSFSPISSMVLLAANENNRLKKLADSSVNKAQWETDIRSLIAYNQMMTTTGGGYFAPVGEVGEVFGLGRVTDSNAYSGFMTLFTQQLFSQVADKPRFKYYVLYPANPQAGKAVNRVVFPKNALKLRIYYTRPFKTQD